MFNLLKVCQAELWYADGCISHHLYIKHHAHALKLNAQTHDVAKYLRSSSTIPTSPCQSKHDRVGCIISSLQCSSPGPCLESFMLQAKLLHTHASCNIVWWQPAAALQSRNIPNPHKSLDLHVSPFHMQTFVMCCRVGLKQLENC